MSRRLVVTRLHVHRFGGTTDRVLTLGDDLLAVRGDNEAGKSTAAEALMWCLAGSRGKAQEVTRWGDLETDVKVSVDGTIDGKEFTVEFTFLLRKGRTPSTKKFTGTIDGATVTEGVWQTSVGQTGTDDAHVVLRLDGVDAHDPDAGDRVLSLASLGTFGSFDPRAAIDALDSTAKTLGVSRRGDDRSVAVAQKEASEHQRALAAALQNVDLHAAQVSALNGLEGKHADLGRQIAELDAERNACTTAREALARRSELTDAVARLDGSGSVAAADRALGEHADALSRAAAFEMTKAPGLRETVDAGRAPGGAWNVSTEDLAALHLDQGQITAAEELAKELGEALGRLRTRSESLDSERADADQAASRASTALAPLGAGVTEHDVAAAQVDQATLSQIQRLSLDRSNAVTDLRNAEKALAEANASCEEAAAHARAAERDWESFGTGMSAAEWNRTRPAQPQPAAAAPIWPPRWLAPAVLVALGIGAFVARSPLLGGAAVAGAILLWFVSGSRSTATAPAPAAASGAMLDAADAVQQTQVLLEGADGTVRAKTSLVDSATIQLETAERALREAVEGAGLPGHGPAELLEAVAGQWQGAHNALTESSGALGKVRAAERALTDQQEVVDSARASVRDFLTSIGVPLPDDLTTAGTHVATVAAAADRARAGRSAQVELDAHDTEVERLLAPAGGRSAFADLDAAAAAAEAAAERVSDYDQLVAAVEAAQVALDDAVGTDPAVQALLDAGAPAEDLDARARSVATEIGELEAQRREVDQQLGQVKALVAELAEASQVARITDEIGQLEEEADDLAVAAVAHALAASVLRAAADREDQARQPELVQRTSALACEVVDEWTAVKVVNDGGTPRLHVVNANGSSVEARRLSTGARTVLYAALRIAVADERDGQTGVRLPLVCDEPLAHLDDERSAAMVQLLRKVSTDRQVLVLTCDARTAELVAAADGRVEQV